MTNIHIVYDELKNITDSMLFNGWQYVTKKDNRIILNKKYHELECVDIEFSEYTIQLSLPLKNSTYSFYNKFNINDTDNSVVTFFNNYINHII